MRNAILIPVLVSAALLIGCSGEPASSSAAEPQTAAPAPAAPAPEPAVVVDPVAAALAGDHRSPGNSDRDDARNPAETLAFFGVAPGQTVVEVWPGGGTAWYTEVLAPVLGAEGTLIGAGTSPNDETEFYARIGAAYHEKITSNPDVYGNVQLVDYSDVAGADLGETGSADAVLLIRLYHNAIMREVENAMLEDAFDVLKPGGVLGVVQHRSPESEPDESERRDGYVRESRVIADAERAGFVLDARAEINANPADTHTHPMGVWSLPPSLRVCREIEEEAARSACESTWRAIGESDRMTLRFVKPAADAASDA